MEAEEHYTASIARWARDPAPYTNRALCRIRLAHVAAPPVLRGAAPLLDRSVSQQVSGAQMRSAEEVVSGPHGGSHGAGTEEEGALLLRLARDDCDLALRLDAGCVRAFERRGDRCETLREERETCAKRWREVAKGLGAWRHGPAAVNGGP